MTCIFKWVKFCGGKFIFITRYGSAFKPKYEKFLQQSRWLKPACMGVVLCLAISTDMYSYFKQHFFKGTLKFIWQMATANNKRKKQINNNEPKIEECL